jgi:hypothetical protein
LAAKPTLDPYSKSHLTQAAARIEKALNAQMTINDGRSGGAGGPIIIMGEEAATLKK